MGIDRVAKGLKQLPNFNGRGAIVTEPLIFTD
jgi:hypothetical protein